MSKSFLGRRSASLIILSLVVAGMVSAQSWRDESPIYPVYNEVLRSYNAAVTEANRTNLSPDERDLVGARLREVRTRAQALKSGQESSPNGSEELKLRYKYLIEALDKEIGRVERMSPPDNVPSVDATGAKIRVLKTRDFSPGDEVEFSFQVPQDLSGKVWVGLMKAEDPHRNLPYLSPSVSVTKYKPNDLGLRTDGVFQYTAPAEGGNWEVRMFEKESGKEATLARFRVENRFVEELKIWQKEIDKLHSELNARFGSQKIRGVFVASFAQAGADDWKGYSQSWSDFFWTERISGNPSTDASFFFHKPKGMVYDSLFTISVLRWKYTDADVQHYRDSMRTWRAQAPRLFTYFEKLILMSGERNRELKETNARQSRLTGRELDAEKQRSKERLQAIGKRYDSVVADLKRLQDKPIFTHRASVKPAETAR